MNYVILGATGHIGNTVVRTILEEQPDANVKVLVRKKHDYMFHGLRVTKSFGLLDNPNFLLGEIDKESIVIYCVGVSDYAGLKKDDVYKINFEYAKLITDVCIKQCAKKLIYVSCTDVIEREEGVRIKEPSKLSPDKIQSDAVASKGVATYYVTTRMKGFNGEDLEGGVVYPSTCIGPYDFKESLISRIIIEHIGSKKPPKYKGGFNFVDVRDVAHAIVSLANNNIEDTFILSNDYMAFDDLLQMVNTIIERDAKGRINNPKIQALIESGCFELPKDKKPILSKFDQKNSKGIYLFDSTKAKNVLGYSNRNIYETVSEMVYFIIDERRKRP